MKNGRLFEILYLLLERRALTAGELAQRFEVSVRTIYRDIDALSAAGIPVYAQKGRGGGIRLMDQFVLSRALLSPRQQDEVLLALRAVAAAGGEEGETLSRLSALFRREGGDWLEVDFTGWGSSQAERETFAAVKGAILERRLLTFIYYSSAGESSRRTAEPARLVFKAGCWYLQAFCLVRQDWRTFRLVRMEQVRAEERTFLPRPVPTGVDQAPQDVPEVRLRLRFSPQAAFRVRDSFHPRQVSVQDGGALLVECAFPEDRWVLGFLLSFGDQVEVLEPAHWRRQLAEAAEKIKNIY